MLDVLLATSPDSRAPAACFARCTRTSRSVVDRPPASTSATRAYSSRSSVAFQPFHTLADTARMSATVRISSSRSRSGDWMVSARSRMVFGSSMSRLNAVALSSRWCSTSQETVSVSSAVRPSAGPDLQREFRAEFGMIAAAALGRCRAGSSPCTARAGTAICSTSSDATGAICDQLAAFHRVEDFHRLDRVLIDGEDMIGVELHLADDAAPSPADSGRETRSRSGSSATCAPSG